MKPEGPGTDGRGGLRGEEAEQNERQHGAIIACSPCVSVARHFLLSPANCGGRRAQQLLSDRAASPLAGRLRSAEGAPLGDVFAFMSGLYSAESWRTRAGSRRGMVSTARRACSSSRRVSGSSLLTR